MFGVVLRCGILLIGGSLLMVPFQMAGSAIADAVATVGPGDSSTVHAIETTVTWFPMVIIGVVCIALLAGAATRRGRI